MPVSKFIKEFLAMKESLEPVIEKNSQPDDLRKGIRSIISSVSPEWEKIITASFLFMPPISPWSASPAFIKLEAEPVLDSVAETFFAICPDLPIPRVILSL